MSNGLSIDERLKIFRSLDFDGFHKQDWEHFSSIHTEWRGAQVSEEYVYCA